VSTCGSEIFPVLLFGNLGELSSKLDNLLVGLCSLECPGSLQVASLPAGLVLFRGTEVAAPPAVNVAFSIGKI
jgi:hypothetical protein